MLTSRREARDARRSTGAVDTARRHRTHPTGVHAHARASVCTRGELQAGEEGAEPAQRPQSCMEVGLGNPSFQPPTTPSRFLTTSPTFQNPNSVYSGPVPTGVPESSCSLRMPLLSSRCGLRERSRHRPAPHLPGIGQGPGARIPREPTTKP